jgi:hypothetical protein
VDASAHRVVGGAGFIIEAFGHFRNTSNEMVVLGPSPSVIRLRHGIRVVQEFTPENLCDATQIAPGETNDFDLQFHTKHDVSDGQHRLQLDTDGFCASC